MSNIYISCPYKKDHLIEKSKMDNHIIKCKDAQKEIKIFKNKLYKCFIDNYVYYTEKTKNKHFSQCQKCNTKYTQIPELNRMENINQNNNDIFKDLDVSRIDNSSIINVPYFDQSNNETEIELDSTSAKLNPTPNEYYNNQIDENTFMKEYFKGENEINTTLELPKKPDNLIEKLKRRKLAKLNKSNEQSVYKDQESVDFFNQSKSNLNISNNLIDNKLHISKEIISNNSNSIDVKENLENNKDLNSSLFNSQNNNKINFIRNNNNVNITNQSINDNDSRMNNSVTNKNEEVDESIFDKSNFY